MTVVRLSDWWSVELTRAGLDVNDRRRSGWVLPLDELDGEEPGPGWDNLVRALEEATDGTDL